MNSIEGSEEENLIRQPPKTKAGKKAMPDSFFNPESDHKDSSKSPAAKKIHSVSNKRHHRIARVSSSSSESSSSSSSSESSSSSSSSSDSSLGLLKTTDKKPRGHDIFTSSDSDRDISVPTSTPAKLSKSSTKVSPSNSQKPSQIPIPVAKTSHKVPNKLISSEIIKTENSNGGNSMKSKIVNMKLCSKICSKFEKKSKPEEVEDEEFRRLKKEEEDAEKWSLTIESDKPKQASESLFKQKLQEAEQKRQEEEAQRRKKKQEEEKIRAEERKRREEEEEEARKVQEEMEKKLKETQEKKEKELAEKKAREEAERKRQGEIEMQAALDSITKTNTVEPQDLTNDRAPSPMYTSFPPDEPLPEEVNISFKNVQCRILYLGCYL